MFLCMYTCESFLICVTKGKCDYDLPAPVYSALNAADIYVSYG